jgi:hypothetical protein
VVCPLCHTRLHAGLDQVGGMLVCPDCGTSAVIPPPPPPQRKIDPTAEAGEDYRLAEGGVAAGPTLLPAAVEAAVERPPEPLYRRPVLPRRPLFSGVFGFPFRADALEPTIKLTSGAVIVKLLIAAALSLGAVGGGGIFALGPAAGSMFLGMIGCVLLLGWIMAASASGLTVLRDTSYGADAIGQWPSVLALEGLGDSVYLSAALSISAMPGAILGVVAEQLGTPASLDVVLSVWLLFPVILLSMLDNNTPMNPLSPPVWRSVFSAWRAWVPFQTVALAATGLFWLTEVVTRRAGLLWNATATGIFLGVAWMVYFRSLGRLAWYCADRVALAEPEEATLENGDGPDDGLAAGAGGEEGESRGVLAIID